MGRDWMPQGVTDWIPFQIDETTKQHIRDQLHAGYQIEVENPEAFFSALNAACTSFNSGRRLVEASKPSKVRANLHAAIDAALELNKRLRDLDLNSCNLIGFTPGRSFISLRECMATILDALHEASHRADEYPKKGRLYDYHRLWLAINVANAIETELGQKPTATKDGLYESILAIVLGLLTGKEVRSVHDLAREALKSRKQNFDNVTISVSQETADFIRWMAAGGAADYMRGLAARMNVSLPPEDD